MSPKNRSYDRHMSRQPPFTVEVADAPSSTGETRPRRNARSSQLLSRPDESISTLFDIVTQGAVRYGDQNAVGSRKLIRVHHETKRVKKMVDGELQDVDKNWSYFELGAYEYISYIEYEKLVLELGAGLRKLGLESPDRVHMFASTSAHWLATAHGAMSQSMPIVTAYDTLGEDGLRHSLVATKAKAIFVEPHLLGTLINTLKDAKDIRYIIYNTDSEQSIREEHVQALKASHKDVVILSFEELRELGASNPIGTTLPSPDDLACIMYTSGSTGIPKGVELKHKNVVAAVAGIKTTLEEWFIPGDTLLAYLPLAHIFELLLEHVALYFGSVMGYGSPRTLSEANCRNCVGDIREFRPTHLVGVPAVWETVKKGVVANVNRGGPIIRTLFWGAFQAKRFLMANGIPGAGVLDSLVFNKVKAATGGRLKICLTAAAPISRETQEFISMTIAPLISAYGSTETSAIGAIGNPRSWTVDACGEVESCVEVKFVDFPDAGYYATNKPNPQGEIWIRGHSVMTGYYENPEETASAMDPEGWFKTGDIGEWDKNGHLKIIDRKKNLVKTLNGEYIALEKLESLYRSATIVGNVCIYASISESHPIAIVQPAEPALIKLADALGVKGHGIGDLVHDEIIQREVLQQMQAIGRRSGLAGIDMIVGVVLADEEWTPQSGLVTATTKLNRRALFERYKEEIEAAYATSRI